MSVAVKGLSYEAIDDRDILILIKRSREGINHNDFRSIQKHIPLKIQEWSKVLHLSERTLQRYKQEKIDFAPVYSEKIIEIQLLFNKGISVFGDSDKFYTWLNSKNLALGGILPISLFDNSFGIMFLKDELTRIENGILA